MTDDSTQYKALVERIGKVERENRRMKRIALALLILPSALLLMAQSQGARVVDANEFTLKDVSGHTRARLWFGQKPGKSPKAVLLTFYDATGKRDLITLAADSAEQAASLNLGGLITDSPSFTLSADAKGTYASLESTGKKLQGIHLAAETEKASVSISGTGDVLKGGVNLTDGAEGGQLQIKDAQNNASVQILANGRDGMSILDRDGRSALLVGDHLTFGDTKQNFPAVLYGGKEGPFLNLQDAQGFNVQLGVSKTITTSGQRRTSSAASIRMFNDKGEIVWWAP